MVRRFFRNILIYCLTLTGVTSRYQKRQQARGPLVRVVAFHDVADQVWFDALVSMMATEFHLLTPAEFVANDFVSDNVNILLTFDDGYASWVTHVLPVLERYQAQGIFFVTSALVDTAGDQTAEAAFCVDRLLRSHRPIIDWSGVEQIVQAGHTIGGHTTWHPNLATVDADTLQREVILNKTRIEAVVDNPVDHFSYPFGTRESYTSEVVAAVRSAGYQYAYSAESNFVAVQAPDQTYHVPRLCIENNLSPAIVRRWINGGYDIFTRIKRYL